MSNTFSDKSPSSLAKLMVKDPFNLRLLVYLGHHAPSVHNIQPWEITINQNARKIKISLSSKRTLVHSDPAYRQSWISIGAFVQNILSVSNTLGLKHTIESLNDKDVVLALKKTSKKPSEESLEATIRVILGRHTNRNNFSDKKMSPRTLRELRNSVIGDSDVEVIFIDNPKTIDNLANLSESAARLAFSSQELKKELDQHINSVYKPKSTGIPAAALSSSFKNRLLEQFASKSTKFASINAQKERSRIENSAALALVFTGGDTKKDWLKAGIEYENLCLSSTSLGLAHSTAATLVEAPDYYKEVAQIFGQKKRLQALVRFGYASPMKNRSQRLPLNEILHVSNDSI